MESNQRSIKVEVTIHKKVQTYEFSKSEFIFGRSGKADISVDDNGISREHIKIRQDNGKVYIQDLNSLNGVYLNGKKIKSATLTQIYPNSLISFGKSQIKMKIHIVEVDVAAEIEAAIDTTDSPPTDEQFEIVTPLAHENPAATPYAGVIPAANDEVSAAAEDSQLLSQEDAKAKAMAAKIVRRSSIPKSEEDVRLNFKNVGLDLPKYKNPGAHAKEIIQEAEYQKHAIIKSAEVFKTKTINETHILAKKAADDAHLEFRKIADALLENTRQELQRLRTETDLLLDEKRLQANEEIQRLWHEHEENVHIDKQKQYESVEKENKIKLDLSIEKARSDMFSERHKMLTEAENEILQKRRSFQVEFENERNEHLIKIKAYADELSKIQSGIEENKKLHKEFKDLRSDAEIELSKTQSLLKAEKESLSILVTSFKETEENHKKIEHELKNFNDSKQRLLIETQRIQDELEKINHSYAKIVEKKIQTDDELKALLQTLQDAKTKAKAEVENEYALLKSHEAKKFEDYRANELKELQKIRDAHTESIKNFSVDLSQEIATKLELLASQAGQKFNFEKHFELINSVIQIKSAVNTGSESKHTQQLESWKERKRKENFSVLAQGFAAGLVIVFALQFAYRKLTIDPVQLELARIAAENKAKDIENLYIPTQTDEYYDNYVDATIYTRQFSETYLNKAHQQEWVNHATKYFLRQWKVEEEKVITVISSSTALVQNISEALPSMKKTKLKAELTKLKELEAQIVENNSATLGSSVRYDAYKKLEKDFFQSKMQGRQPATTD